MSTWWNILIIAGSVVLVGLMAALLVWRMRYRSTARLTSMEFTDPCEIKVEGSSAEVEANAANAEHSNSVLDNGDGKLPDKLATTTIDVCHHEDVVTPGKITARTIDIPPAQTDELPSTAISLVTVPMTASTPQRVPSSDDESEDDAENSPMLPDSEQEEILDDDDMPDLPPPPIVVKALPEQSPPKVNIGLSSVPSTPMAKTTSDPSQRVSAQVKLHALEQQFFPLPSPVAIKHVPESPRYADGSLSHTKQSKLPTFNISVNHSSSGDGLAISMTHQDQEQHQHQHHQLPPLAGSSRRNSLVTASTPQRDMEGSIQITTPKGLPPMPMLRKRSDSIGGCSAGYKPSQVPSSPMRKISIPSSPMAGSSSSPYRKSLNGSVWSSVSARFAGSHLPHGSGSHRGGSRAGSSLGSYIHNGSAAGSANGSQHLPPARYTTPSTSQLPPPATNHYRTGMITKPLPHIPQHHHQQQKQHQHQHQQHHTYKCIENMHVIPRPSVTADGSLDRGVPVGGMGAVLKKNPFYFSDLMMDWERRSGKNNYPAPSPIPNYIVDNAFDVPDADWADLDEANRLREGVDIASSTYWTAFLGEVERLRK